MTVVGLSNEWEGKQVITRTASIYIHNSIECNHVICSGSAVVRLPDMEGAMQNGK